MIVDTQVKLHVASYDPVARLAALGVARVSFGPRLQRSLYDQFTTILAAVASDDDLPGTLQ